MEQNAQCRSLITIIEEEYSLYSRLLSLNKQQAEFLKKNNTGEIKNTVEEMMPLLEKIQGLEDRRKKLLDEIAGTENIPRSQITMSRLSSLWNEGSLLELKDRLRAVLEELKKVQGKNMLLLEQAENVYGRLRKAFYSVLQNPVCYDSQGMIQSNQRGYFERKV